MKLPNILVERYGALAAPRFTRSVRHEEKMNMNKIVCIVLVLTAMFLGGCGNVRNGKSAALSQVPVFHQQFNDGNLEAIVAGAHPDMLKDSSKSQVTNFIGVVRRKLGKVTDSQSVNWNIQTFNASTRVVLIQNTTFENGKGTETFTFQIEKEKACLLGYHIESQDLIMK